MTYTVVHEYYRGGTFVGSTQSTYTGKPGSTVSAGDIDKITSYEGQNYSYLYANPETMVLAADGENIMTLSYTRSSGGGGSSSDPDPTPDTDIDDPDVPTTDLPDVPGTTESTTPTEPTTPAEDVTEIEDPDVPMAEAPKTGDSSFAYLPLVSLAAGIALVVLNLKGKRGKRAED